MLVLTRKKNDSVVIDGEIKIEVLQIKGNQVRLGITAPASMKILRGELPLYENDTKPTAWTEPSSGSFSCVAEAL